MTAAEKIVLIPQSPHLMAEVSGNVSGAAILGGHEKRRIGPREGPLDEARVPYIALQHRGAEVGESLEPFRITAYDVDVVPGVEETAGDPRSDAPGDARDQRFPLLHFRPKHYLPGLSDRVSDNLPWCNLSGRLEHTGMRLQILGCDFNGYAPRTPAEALAPV